MKKIISLSIAAIFSSFAYSQSWLIDGNTGINVKINFIGTKDDNPLVFRIRNNFAGLIDSAYRMTFFGYGAGKNQSGTDNTAFGFKALNVNNTGTYNTAVGSFALNANTTGIYNTATGYNSLGKNNAGQQNSAFGMYALGFNLTGFGNTGMGAYALNGNTGGSYNTAQGYEALYYNNGERNTAVGATALISNMTGSYNTALGYEALVNTNTNSCTGIGYQSMRFNYGPNNTAVGYTTLYYNGSSQYNTAIGHNAGGNYDLGWNNVFLGANTRTNGYGYYNCIAVGQDVVCTAVSQARIGNAATSSIGGYVGWSNISDGRYKREIKEDVKGLEFIMQLRPVTYHLDITGLRKKLGEGKDENGKERAMDVSTRQSISDKEKEVYTGFIAQEVEQAAKKVNYDFSGVDKPKNDNDLYGLRYAEFVVPLVKAVQEQQNQINDLKKQVEALIELNKQLQQQVKPAISMN